jgi:predicted chitinase
VKKPLLTPDQLRKMMPKIENAEKGAETLNKAMRFADITNCYRQSAFIAQVGQETEDLKYLEQVYGIEVMRTGLKNEECCR